MKRENLLGGLFMLGAMIVTLGVAGGLYSATSIDVNTYYRKATEPGLQMVYLNRVIALNQGIAPEVWKDLPAYTVAMSKQTVVAPFSKGEPSSLTVKAFHNNFHAYFYVEFIDDTFDQNYKFSKFADAAAIMFPIGTPNASMVMMGNTGLVNIWQWRADLNQKVWEPVKETERTYSDFYYPFEDKEVLDKYRHDNPHAAVDFIAKGFTTITPKPLQRIEARGQWANNKWAVVIKRALKTASPDSDAQLEPGKTHSMALAIWDGGKEDIAGRKSISGMNWHPVHIQTPPSDIPPMNIGYLTQEIDLNNGLGTEVWNAIPAYPVGMSKQTVVVPYSRSEPSLLLAKSFHNRKNVYFCLQFADPTQDGDYKFSRFADAAAIMFPVEKANPAMVIMGNTGKVNIWQWRADLDLKIWGKVIETERTYSDFYYPFENKEVLEKFQHNFQSAGINFVAKGFTTITPTPNQPLEARGGWDNGVWTVVIKRALQTPANDSDTQLVPGQATALALALWDGRQEDIAGRKKISGLNWIPVALDK